MKDRRNSLPEIWKSVRLGFGILWGAGMVILLACMYPKVAAAIFLSLVTVMLLSLFIFVIHIERTKQ